MPSCQMSAPSALIDHPPPGGPATAAHLRAGLGLAKKNLNDHETLREDLAWQTALERTEPLAGDSTLCRLEQRVDRKAAVAFHQVLLEQFIASFREAPSELILDFDATDDRVHGNQEGRHFHGYYGDWCFLPLYVFCGEQLLVSYLRPSNIDAARHSWAILKLLTQRLRAEWPQVKLILRADSGFCRWKMLRWCEGAGVDYIIGLAKNARLEALSQPLMAQAQAAFAATAQKQRLLSWIDLRRRHLGSATARDRQSRTDREGENPRFVLTSLEGDAQKLYDQVYCARGEMENRIKEQQLGLFSDRTSAHGWWANQFRVLLSAAAYVLLETILVGSDCKAPRTGARPSDHHPAQTPEDRDGDRAQHAAHPSPLEQHLSVSGTLRARLHGSRTNLRPREALPRRQGARRGVGGSVPGCQLDAGNGQKIRQLAPPRGSGCRKSGRLGRG